MAPRAKDRTWNPETDALLSKLWNEGLSCSQIGKRLGVSRNSAIGRIHRLGIPRIGPYVAKGGRRVAAPKPKSLPKPPEPLPMPEPEPVTAVPTEFLGHSMCRFPVSAEGAPWLHCGAKTPNSQDPWCPHHRRIVYQPAPKRRVA